MALCLCSAALLEDQLSDNVYRGDLAHEDVLQPMLIFPGAQDDPLPPTVA